jgi:hypothetical protein
MHRESSVPLLMSALFRKKRSKMHRESSVPLLLSSTIFTVLPLGKSFWAIAVDAPFVFHAPLPSAFTSCHPVINTEIVASFY